MGPWTKFDDGNQLRGEIERRTRDGETCDQIASALKAQGFDVSNKTISRRRVEWGLRKRASPKTKGTTRPRPQRSVLEDSMPSRYHRGASLRKVEIAERTARGESAQEICDALVGNGVQIKKGAATILRLQTYWGLIPYDADRAFGRGKYKKKKTTAPDSGRTRRRGNRQTNQEPRVSQFYPSNSRFGPNPTIEYVRQDPQRDEVDFSGVDSTGERQTVWPVNPDPPSPVTSSIAPPVSSAPPPPRASTLEMIARPSVQADALSPHLDAIEVAAELMTAQTLIDLTMTAMSAAAQMKETLMGFQSGALSQNASTLAAVRTSKRKARDAAQVAMTLASTSR